MFKTLYIVTWEICDMVSFERRSLA